MIPLRKASSPAIRPSSPSRVTAPSSPSVFRSRPSPESWTQGSGLYVATPAVLRYLGIDPATSTRARTSWPTRPFPPASSSSWTSGRGGELRHRERPEDRQPGGLRRWRGGHRPRAVLLRHPQRYAPPRLEAGPERLAHRVEQPLTSEQIATARELAAEAGLEIEIQHERTSLATPIAIATAAGALLALAILAMTVGLIRSESAGDLRTLTATGATGRTRRTLTAATAGALALLGALLGVAGAYVVLVATYHDDLGYLGRVPAVPLVLIVVGVPLTATAAGWLLAGREPPAIARPAIE